MCEGNVWMRREMRRKRQTQSTQETRGLSLLVCSASVTSGRPQNLPGVGTCHRIYQACELFVGCPCLHARIFSFARCADWVRQRPGKFCYTHQADHSRASFLRAQVTTVLLLVRFRLTGFDVRCFVFDAPMFNV